MPLRMELVVDVNEATLQYDQLRWHDACPIKTREAKLRSWGGFLKIVARMLSPEMLKQMGAAPVKAEKDNRSDKIIN